jgi:hypothetical protein
VPRLHAWNCGGSALAALLLELLLELRGSGQGAVLLPLELGSRLLHALKLLAGFLSAQPRFTYATNSKFQM